MRLTKQTGHAIRILIDCAHAGDRLVKVADISQRLGLTKQNVFKIVHLLSRAAFVSAVRGPHGGVRLGRPAEKIRIGDVVRAMEITSIEVKGADGERAGKMNGGAINTIFDDALSAFITVLDQHTLDELAGPLAKAGPEIAAGAKPRSPRNKSIVVARSTRRS